MKKFLIGTFFAIGFAAFWFGTWTSAQQEIAASKASGSDRDTAYATYRHCSDAAMQRPLSLGEVDACGAAYLRLKLSFVEGVSYDDFRGLSTAEKARVNREGYAAFQDWRGQRLIALRQ